jgi:hypothetical protein
MAATIGKMPAKNVPSVASATRYAIGKANKNVEIATRFQ